jgi:hypothetical protein
MFYFPSSIIGRLYDDLNIIVGQDVGTINLKLKKTQSGYGY